MAEPTEAEIGQVLAAHARQSQQLSEARSALAEAVQTLRDELAGNRADLSRSREHARAQEAEITQLKAEITKLAAYAAQMEQEARETHAAYASLHHDLVALQNTKLMRWSAPWRASVQRLRSGGRHHDGA